MLLDRIVNVLKETSRLGALSFMLAMVGIGVLLLYWRRTAVWGRRWLTAVLLGYWFLSTPMGAWTLSAPISMRYGPIASREEAQGAQAVVMLGGGIESSVAGGLAIDDLAASALRVIETARVYRLMGDPLVIVSGGNTQRLLPSRSEAQAYRNAAIGLGIPASRMVVEERSLTTRQQAVVLKRILAERGIQRFVLVTSPTHMGRSLATFRAVGLDPIPSASPLRSSPGDTFWTLWPDRQSLLISDIAVYDYVAWGYYWWRGWL